MWFVFRIENIPDFDSIERGHLCCLCFEVLIALLFLCTYIVLKASSCVTFSVNFLPLKQVLFVSIQAPAIQYWRYDFLTYKYWLIITPTVIQSINSDVKLCISECDAINLQYKLHPECWPYFRHIFRKKFLWCDMSYIRNLMVCNLSQNLHQIYINLEDKLGNCLCY